MWSLVFVVSILWVRETSSFVTQKNNFGVSSNSPRNVAAALQPLRKKSSFRSATVNGESSSAKSSGSSDDNKKSSGGGSTATASKPGFPLHSLFVAAARAAVPKPADTGSGAHDAVSFVLWRKRKRKNEFFLVSRRLTWIYSPHQPSFIPCFSFFFFRML
jgi:hypothetical protein